MDQRMEALELANGIRVRRAELKRALREGRADVRELVIDPPGELLTMKVFDLLLATPKFGRVKVNRLLGRCRMSPSKTVGGMTMRQRLELAEALRWRQ